MSTYRAPLGDINFVLKRFCRLDSLMATPAFAGVDSSVVPDMLAEAARFFEGTFAPLNRVGDEQGSRRNDDGSVSTPEGFRDAYRAYVDAGWGAVAMESTSRAWDMC